MRQLFRSLGSRLLITHMLVALTVLLMVSIALLLSVVPVQRALTFRQLTSNRQASLLLGRQLLKGEPKTRNDLPQPFSQALREQAQTQAVRILLINPGTQLVIFDTANRLTGSRWPESLSGEAQAVRWWQWLAGNRSVRNQVLRSSLRLETGFWFYVAGPLTKSATAPILVVARQRVPVWNTIRAVTEEVPPFFMLGVLLFLIAMIYLLSAWVAGSVTRNLAPVIAGTQQLAAGQLAYRVPEQASALKEVGQLAASFNRMAERVQQTQQAQRDFVANVSHDLKTPLTSIQGFAQALLDGAAANPAAQTRAIAIIHAEAQRLNQLVNDLLEAMSLDSGQLQLQRQPFDLNQRLGDLIQAYAVHAEKAQVQLLWQPTATPLNILADPDSLLRIFTNLLDNAFNYTAAGGTITVSSRSLTLPDAAAPGQTTAVAEVSVADTGKGIPAADLPRLFDRFYQVDKARSGKRGFGLGLSIVRGIVEAHGGRVGVESTEGQGSRFWVHLPRIS